MTAADRLDEIEARADAATDGPWETRLFDGLPGKKVVGKREPSDLGRGPIVLMQPIFCTEQSADNAEFIAHARTDVPALVAALRAVLNRHRRREAYDGNLDYCVVCVHTYGADWPCPDVRAINTALGEVAS